MKSIDVYNNSPIWLQNIFVTIEGYRLKKERYSFHYYSYFNELKKRNYYDFEEIQKYQNKKVVEIVNYAYHNSSFYKDFYKEIDINKIKCVTDLKKLPILEKELVRKNLQNIYTIPIKKGIKVNTSGTTGKTMTFLYTKNDFQKRMAYLDFFKSLNGFHHLTMRRASFNAAKVVPINQKSKVFWRDNLSIKQRIYSGYHCQGKNLKFYINDLNKYKPQSLDGYPSALYQLARYILKNNIVLSYKPIAIFPTAEVLPPNYKNMIEEAFSCPVLDQYASSEGAPFINMCKNGNLHYCMDTGVIEIDNNGDMLVTCFETHGTPLIRYRIGDKIIFSEENKNCSCGSCFPIVKRIDGRNHEYLISLSKGKFPSLYMSLVSEEFQNSVKAMQFIQNKPNEIIVLLEVDDNYHQSMGQVILGKLHYSLGKDMKIKINVVDKIPKEKSGKFRLIINNYLNDKEINNGYK